MNPVLPAHSETVLSGGKIAPDGLSVYELCPVSGLQSRDCGAAGTVGCEDAAEGSVSLDGGPVDRMDRVDSEQRIVRVGGLCYPGQLPSDPSLDFHADVLPQPILSEDDVPPVSSAADLLPMHLLPPALQLLDPLDPLEPLHPVHPCLLLDGETEPRDPTVEEPKVQKRKGGWPKGKKRKPQSEFSAPRAPTTGYVIFVNERKVRLKAENPDLPFVEITKMLGVQWSQLSAEDKQRYNDVAEKDKQRYLQELMAFQNTEAYRAFMKRKALTKAEELCGVQCGDADLENEALALSQMDQGDGNSDLYCRTCNQYFSSLHNKKEHLLGRQHLQTLTEEFEKEKDERLKAAELQEEPGRVEANDAGWGVEPAPLGWVSSLDLRVLEELLLRHMNLRELELQELKATLEQAKKQQEHLNEELRELERRKCGLEQELWALRQGRGSLQSQIHELKVLHQQLLKNLEGNAAVRVEPSGTVLQTQSVSTDSLVD